MRPASLSFALALSRFERTSRIAAMGKGLRMSALSSSTHYCFVGPGGDFDGKLGSEPRRELAMKPDLPCSLELWEA
jgi:hypothetical protein